MSNPVFMRRELYFRKCNFCNAFEVTDKRSSGEITHLHDYAQIWFVTRGQCDHIVEGRTYVMTVGDTFLIAPMAAHQTLLHPDSAALTCEFSLEDLFADSVSEGKEKIQSYLDRMSILNFLQDFKTRQPRFRFRTEVLPTVERLMREILEEYHEEKPCYQDMLRVKLQELLLLYIREFLISPDYQSTDAAYERYRILMDRAIQYIDTHYANPISLEDVCRISTLSKTYFCYLFKMVTKKTFVEYLTERRIQGAIQMLESTDCSIQQISEETGFHDAANFSRTFRKVMGVSPRDYRKMRTLLGQIGED